MPELRTKDFKLSAIKLANDFSENNLKIVEVYISKEQEIIQKLVSMLPHADMYLKTDVQVFDNKKLPKNTEVFFSIIFNEASSENRVLMNRMI
jgi:RecA/RadA recombinase